MKDDIDTKF